MLFHDSDIATFINDNFEPTWEKVREVPRAEIDFGNGKKLTRTLNGNVGTYFVTAGGGVFDIVPGIVSPTEYMRRLTAATAQYRQLHNVPLAEQKSAVAHYHREMTELASKGVAGIMAQGQRIGPGPDMRKFIVEGPVKKAFGTRGVERRVGYMLMAAGTEKKAGKKDQELVAETDYNIEKRYPKVHKLLTGRALATPKSLTRVVYKSILDVDLDDPYLGLAPYVMGGEVGRK